MTATAASRASSPAPRPSLPAAPRPEPPGPLAASAIFGLRPAGAAPGASPGSGLLLVFALSLSWVWTPIGWVVRPPQAVMSIGTVVLFPLTLASSVFVRPRTMPGWLQAFVDVNPVSHLVTAERGLMGGHPAAGQITWVLVASAAPAAVFAPPPPPPPPQRPLRPPGPRPPPE